MQTTLLLVSSLNITEAPNPPPIVASSTLSITEITQMKPQQVRLNVQYVDPF